MMILKKLSLYTCVAAILIFHSTDFSIAQNLGKKYWIYFVDKGPVVTNQISKIARENLSNRAIQRRLKRGIPGKNFDGSDLPVYNHYIQQTRNFGIDVVQKSRWLNAISVRATDAQIAELSELSFVKKTHPVGFYKRKSVVYDKSIQNLPSESLIEKTSNLDYGASINQIQICNVEPLHAEGLTGKDVLITLIDSGFFHDQHQALQHLNILAERDFINNDEQTSNEDGQDTASQHSHGTRVLSAIGGFMPGSLIGPAYGATYALAKTEHIPTETRTEEDNWVAAVEWADSLGTDIISSSLGYLEFDDGFTYPLSALDGRTMVTSIAATMAVEKGIIVVTSAGNEGNHPIWPYVWSPADGIGVIAAGGVNPDGSRYSGSSIGPTADNRIKPDVLAMATSVATVNPGSSDLLFSDRGTSFAAPIIAGICALIVERHPNSTPGDILTSLTATASQSDSPDNLMGYGIVDALKAANFLGTGPTEIPETFKFHPTTINLISGYTRFFVDLTATEEVTISIYNAIGQKIDRIQRTISAGTRQSLLWNWPNNLSSGIYFAHFSTSTKEGLQKTMIVR